MWPLMSRISFCIAGLSWPTPTISKACTSGMPAASMVASWRLKTAMSSGLILPPPLKSWRSFFTLTAITPWRRSSAWTSFSLTASVRPLSRLPLRSVPSQTQGNSFFASAAACAMSARPDYVKRPNASPNRTQSTVTRLTSSRLVRPSRTFLRPAVLRSQIPSRRAASRMSLALPPARMIRPISSVTGMTS